MATTSLNFKKLSAKTDMSKSGLIKGATYFESKTGLIHVATGATTYQTFGPIITRALTSGTKIATITMGSQSYDLYCEKNTVRDITDAVDVTSSTTSASATAVKTAYDQAVAAYNLANGKTANKGTVTKVVWEGSNGLTGSGDFTTSGTVSISGVDATTSTKGVVQLSNATNSNSETLAATPKAVKSAYDLAASKTANTGTVTKVSTGAGLTGGDITTTGTIKANLKSETESSLEAASMGSTADRQYAVGLDSKGYLSVNIPWEVDTWRPITDAVNSNDSNTSASAKAVKTAYDLAASKTSNTGTVTQISTGTGLTGGNITTSGTISISNTYQTYISNGNAAYSYFTNGVANSAAKLSTVNKSIWGQTYWTANGVPQDVTGNMSNVGNITMSGAIKMGDATISYDSSEKCIKFSF